MDTLASSINAINISSNEKTRKKVSIIGHKLVMNKAADAAAIVDELEKEDTIEVVELSGNSLGIEAAEAVGKALAKQANLKIAVWSDLFTSRLKTEIGPALRHLSEGVMSAGATLVELDVSENAFGPNGIVGITELLASPACYTLKILKMNNQGLGHEGCRRLVEALKRGRQASNKKGLQLRVFLAGRNRLENVGAGLLAEVFSDGMDSLEELSLYQNGIGIHGVDGVRALVHSLRNHSNLRSLNLSDNSVKPSGARAIVGVLPKLLKLQVLNLSDCLLKSAGTTALSKLMEEDSGVLPDLRELDLSGNEIRKVASLEIALTAVNRVHLSRLNLNDNEMGREGRRDVERVMESAGKLTALVPVEQTSDDEGEEENESEDESEEESENEEEEEEASDEEEIGQEQVSSKEHPKATTPANVFGGGFSFRGALKSLDNAQGDAVTGPSKEHPKAPTTANPFSFSSALQSVEKDEHVGTGGLFTNLNLTTGVSGGRSSFSGLWSAAASSGGGSLGSAPTTTISTERRQQQGSQQVAPLLAACLEAVECREDDLAQLTAVPDLTSKLEYYLASAPSTGSDIANITPVHSQLSANPERGVRLALRLAVACGPGAGAVLLGRLLRDEPVRATNAVLVEMGCIKSEEKKMKRILNSSTAVGIGCRALELVLNPPDTKLSSTDPLSPDTVRCLSAVLTTRPPPDATDPTKLDPLLGLLEKFFGLQINSDSTSVTTNGHGHN